MDTVCTEQLKLTTNHYFFEYESQYRFESIDRVEIFSYIYIQTAFKLILKKWIKHLKIIAYNREKALFMHKLNLSDTCFYHFKFYHIILAAKKN